MLVLILDMDACRRTPPRWAMNWWYVYLAVALVWALNVAGSASARRVSHCEELGACLVLYNSLGSPTGSQTKPALVDAHEVQQFCNNIRTMPHCVARYIGSCERRRTVNAARTALIISSYLCSPQALDQIRAIDEQGPTCFDDEATSTLLERQFVACYGEFESESERIIPTIRRGRRPISDLCVPAQRVVACISRAVSGACSHRVTTFFISLIRHGMAMANEELNCPGSALMARHLSVRSLGLLQRRR